MWGAEAWGEVPWGALVDQTGAATVAPTVTVVVGVLVGRSPSPSLEGQAEAFAVVGEAPSVWLPAMRVGG